MAANQSHTHDGRGILLYSGEMVLVFTKQVYLTFKKYAESFFNGKKTGNLYLTSHRIIFLGTDDGALKSLSMPFECLNNIQLEQPLFGGNYLEGTLAAQPGGNFEGEVVWRLTFNKGGCIDFGKALRQAVMMVHSQRPANAPPPYVPPAGSYFAAPPVYSAAPQPQNYNGFQAPTHVFPDRPEEGTLFVYDQPPPYAGIPMNNPSAAAGGGGQPPMYPSLNNPPYPAGGDGNAAPPYPTGPGANAAAPPYPAGPGSSTNPNPSAPPSYEDATKLPDKKNL